MRVRPRGEVTRTRAVASSTGREKSVDTADNEVVIEASVASKDSDALETAEMTVEAEPEST